MDYGSYLQLKMRATNNYKSNWQARDASEVTMRNRSIATANVSSTHQGPDDSCIPCTVASHPTSSTNPPNNGFSSDYSSDYSLGMKKAGQSACNDPVWGKSGGVNLKTQSEISKMTSDNDGAKKEYQKVLKLLADKNKELDDVILQIEAMKDKVRKIL